jgi:hypothetical protein
VGRDCGVLAPDYTGRAAAVRMVGAVEDSPGCGLLHKHAVAGLRRRGCSRSLDRGLGPARSSLDLTWCLSESVYTEG